MTFSSSVAPNNNLSSSDGERVSSVQRRDGGEGASLEEGEIGAPKAWSVLGAAARQYRSAKLFHGVFYVAPVMLYCVALFIAGLMSIQFDAPQGTDKLLHALCFGMLEGFIGLSLVWFLPLLPVMKRSFLSVSIAVGLGGALELAQHWAPNRTPDWADFWADVAGVVLAFAVFHLWRNRSKFKVASSIGTSGVYETGSPAFGRIWLSPEQSSVTTPLAITRLKEKSAKRQSTDLVRNNAVRKVLAAEATARMAFGSQPSISTK